MLDRVAAYIKKVMLPVSKVCSSIGMVAMVLLMLVIVVGVVSRRFFELPIRGLRDLTTMGFSIMVFLPMAWCAITDGHVSMSVITNRFPKLSRTILSAIILLISTVVMVLFTWQLYVYAARQQAMAQSTILLGIPTSPFLYAATLGMLLMTIVFFMKFLVSLDDIRRRK